MIGEKGQQKLLSSSVLVVGCGGLGCTILSELVRAGVGKVKLVDRDIVSLPDLQRQILYDEEDVENKLPKAKIAAEKLKKINSQVKLESFILEVNSENIKNLLRDVNLVIDATDNIETRFIINKACVENKIPWIHGAVHGSIGMSMNIIPGKTACYRCLI
ncbi:HesA/MoeB/ThiF family protein, partial [Candidatus Aerophobetes bacterium]|nr:HesA/MoeB/ThiF family protein [Candidatus Aerophobetes bacterium]